jgi:outer membrane murein-binding lipoprotein Lpp
VSSTVDLDQASSVIRTLTTQVAELKRRHREEIHALQQALETAQGENLELRRRLGHNRAHRPETP